MKQVYKLNKANEIPQTYGVYFFLDKKKKVLYVGKSVNLKKRIANHLQNPFDPKTRAFVAESQYIRILPTNNEFEALIAEAKFIKKYQPHYNIEAKDDKSPTYIGISSDPFPIIKLVKATNQNPAWQHFGPFLNNKEPALLLRYIRQIIPFATHKPQKKTCLYYEIGLCNPCPSQRKNRGQYLKNISRIKSILSGKKSLNLLLTTDIKKAVRLMEFEKAQKLTSLLALLSKPRDNRSLWDFDNQEKNQKEREDALTILRPFFPTLQLNRIECFDASHHWGNYLYVGMAVLIKGLIDKSQYRLFAIKTATNNDPQALKEALERRLKHLSDWGKPDLIILDGGLPQIQIVGPLLKKSHLAYIGLAKPEEKLHIPEKNVTLKATGGLLTLTTRLRDEAHRFTINQSRKAFLNRR